MYVGHHRCYPVESGFVPGPSGADYGVADPQAGQLGQVVEDAGPVFVRFDEGGHRLLDGVVVAAGILTVRAKDIELVLQVVSETGSGQIEQVAHVAITGDKAQSLALSAAGNQDRRVRVLQSIRRIERPKQLVVRSLPG